MNHDLIRKTRAALLLGDPGGIGPELIVKLLQRTEVRGLADVLVLGDHWVLEEAQRMVGMTLGLESVSNPDQFPASSTPAFLETGFSRPDEVVPCRATAAAGASVIQSLAMAVDLAKRGIVDCICYAPLNKQALHLAGMRFPDELRWLAHALDHRDDLGEFNVLGKAWTSRVTSHIPISEVPRRITLASVQKAIRLIHRSMVAAGIDAPRIAVAGLNPHAGEGGNFGREEIDVIEPAVAELAGAGISVHGPFPADTVFLKLRDGIFDAVVTMYHDQGQIAMKLMGFQRGVTVAGGLPIAITTPAHGTAFDIAGQGVADASAMVEAYKLAIRLAGCV